MKSFLTTLLVIFVIVAVLFITSALLDINYVQQQWSRQAIVYLLMAMELFVGTKLYIAINRK